MRDNQPSMKLQVVQGERLRPADNRALTELSIKDLSKGPRGSVKVEVEFSVSKEGELTVTATEQTSKKSVEAKVSQGEEKQVMPTAEQQAADNALREQVGEFVTTRRYAESVRTRLKDKTLKDESGVIFATLGNLLKWITEVDSTEQFPSIAQTTAKRRELEAKVELPLETKRNVEHDDGEDEGDEDGPDAAPSDEDLD
jgi:molecular chaperone DnaK (HSP70)